MARVTVPVLKPLTYQGRSYVRGESVTMDAIEAAACGRAGTVSLTRGVKVAAATYRTRDLAADAPDTTVRPRRRYRRRDMTAEGSQ